MQKKRGIISLTPMSVGVMVALELNDSDVFFKFPCGFLAMFGKNLCV